MQRMSEEEKKDGERCARQQQQQKIVVCHWTHKRKSTNDFILFKLFSFYRCALLLSLFTFFLYSFLLPSALFLFVRSIFVIHFDYLLFVYTIFALAVTFIGYSLHKNSLVHNDNNDDDAGKWNAMQNWNILSAYKRIE